MIMPWSPRKMKKWTLSDALNVSSMDVIRMKVPERAELAAFLQKQYNTRVRSFKRARYYNHPYAYTKLQQDFDELNEASGYNFDFNSPVIKSSKGKHMLGDAYANLEYPAQKLHSYISQMQEFFNSKSSTIKGWREIIRNESEMLFGSREYNTKNGKRKVLNHLMTEQEREYFWKLYDEIRKSGRTIIYDSESMRETGFTRIWREKVKNKTWEYNDLTGMMKEMLNELRSSGISVRDIEEHIPNRKNDPFQQDDDKDEDFEIFVW